MKFRIHFEDIVANGLILKMEQGEGRVISNIELKEYAEKIQQWWRKYRNTDVIITFTSYDAWLLFAEYPEFYELTAESDETFAIALKKNRTVTDLRKKFRPYLSVDMLLSFLLMPQEDRS